MIFSKAALWLLCTLLLLSVLMANLLNMIATDQHFYSDDKNISINYRKHLEKKFGVITDTTENLVWFLQISDIHISIFRDPGRITQFQQFCDSTVKKIKPVVVLASGDLTDAKAKDNLGSSQVKKEWVYYYNIIKESGVTDDTTWLDIRGNHDNFNIRSLNAEENYFKNYSVQGKDHSKSYLHMVEKNGVNLAFIGLDACPEPGLRRPFNFIGILDPQEQQTLQRLKKKAEAKADHIVWFGHYPTSCILSIEKDSERLDVRQLIGSSPASRAYLCGHLHAMGGLVPKMYTKQKRGFLELELEDWKDNRMYRLAAIDHGQFSFVDQKHNVWPLVLVTNPKHARYNLPEREPTNLVYSSTHIRILAFSDVRISSVKISFDKESWMECRHKDGPLYVCTWLPHLFKNHLHYMYVIAKDELGRETFIENQFTLDGTSVYFEIIPRILLMVDARTVFQLIFATLLIINVLPLVILRVQKTPPKICRRYGCHIVKRIWLLSKIDRVFWPIVLYAIYLPFGPWAIGRLLDDYIGVIFAWGIVIKGAFLPEPFTYMYGGVQLMFVQIPLVYILAYCLEIRMFKRNIRGVRHVFVQFPFIFLLSLQLLLAYFFWLEYGTLSFLFGPLRTWSIVLTILLWYKTVTLPADYCSKLSKLDQPTQ